MDEESAESLLADLSAEQRLQIQQAVDALTDVSSREEHDVAAELLLLTDDVESTADGNVELFPAEMLSLPPVQTREASGCLRASSNDTRDALSAALRKTSGESLCCVLRDEYPQTLAIIVSRMPPDEAAKFLAGLSACQRADIMRRIADMDSMDKDVVEDVCAELSHLVDTKLSEIDGSLVGRDAVKAILFAAQGEQRTRLIESLSAGDPRLAVQLGLTAETTSIPNVSEPQSAGADQHWSFDRFLKLGPQQLARVVRSADTEIVLLALIGASPDQIDRVLSGLHANEGSSIRRRLSAIGPVRLRDIEYAQLELVQVAQRMHREGNKAGFSRSQGLRLSV
jgi:flagellar motor switch protein FliG